MQDVQAKLNAGLPWQRQNSTRRRFLPPSNLTLRQKQGVTVKTFKEMKNCIVISEKNRIQRRS